MNNNPNPPAAPVAWYSDPQPILFDQIEVGQGALFTRDELPAPVEVEVFDSPPGPEPAPIVPSSDPLWWTIGDAGSFEELAL